MCGFAGFFRRRLNQGDPSAAHDASLVTKALESIIPRGPDQTGVWTSRSGDLLIHARLMLQGNVIDGAQPIATEDNALAYNGEIYNLEQFKQDFNLGSQTKKSDTGALFDALRYNDTIDICNAINGMFAFAYLDQRSRQLVLAVDRFGQKPLFYCETNERIFFGSTIESVATLANCNLELDPQAVHSYLACGFVPPHQCIFKNIRKVQPGHVMIHQSDGSIDIRPFSKCPTHSQQNNQSVSQALKDSVELCSRQFRSEDMPVGLFLSGGLDSNSILRSMPVGVKAHGFTFAFEGSYDESKAAKRNSYNLKHPHQTIVANHQQVREAFDSLIKNNDEPFADRSATPLSILSREASQVTRLVLTGDGGDELFFGYRRHLAAYYWDYLRRLPKQILQKFLGPKIRGFNSDSFLFAYICSLSTDVPFNIVDNAVNGMESSKIKYQMTSDLQINNYASAFRALDLNIYLPGNVCVKSDRVTMMYGLEARAPFLQDQLWEVARHFSPEICIKYFRGKMPLRRATSAKTQIIKRGFTPDPTFRKHGYLKHEISDLISIGHASAEDENVLPNIDFHLLSDYQWRLFCLGAWVCRKNIS